MYKDRNKWKELEGKWRVTCDRSGFRCLSDDMVIDHRGRCIHKDYVDDIHFTEYPYTWPIEDTKLPFKRPIIKPTVGVQQRITWGKTRFTWGELHRLWSSRY